MATSDRQCQHGRRVLELGTQDALLAQNKILTRQIKKLTKQITNLP